MRTDSARLRPKRVVGEFLSKPESTDVVARTTDAFVHVAKDTRSAEDAQLIQGLVGTAVKTAGVQYAENTQEDEKQGKQDALDGNGLSEPQGFLHSPKAYAKGYHGIEDEARGINFKAEYLSILKDNDFFVGTGKAEEQKDSIYKELYKKYYGEDYLKANGRDGMLTDSGLARLEEARLEGESQFRARATEYHKNEFVNNSRTIINDMVNKIIDSKVDAPDALSATIDSVHAEFVNTRGNIISKPEYQGLVIDSLGQKAIEMARTGDVEGARSLTAMIRELRDRDGKFYDKVSSSDAKTGISKYSLRGAIDAIDADVSKEIDMSEKIAKKAKEKQEDNILNGVTLGVSSLVDITDIKQRQEKLLTVRDNLRVAISKGLVSDGKARAYLQTLDDLATNQGFRDKSMAIVKIKAEQYANRPDASFEGLMAGYAGGLSAEDVIHVSGKIKSNQEAFIKAGKENVTKSQKMWDDMMKEQENILKSDSSMFSGVSKDTNEKIQQLNDLSRDTITEFVKTNGRVPSVGELNKLREEIVKFMGITDKYFNSEEESLNGFNDNGGSTKPPKDKGSDTKSTQSKSGSNLTSGPFGF